MGKVAFLLSGQGAQKPGMGAGLMDIPEAREVFDAAAEVFGFDVADACLNAEPERLNDTAIAQPAMCACSVASAAALRAAGVEPQFVAGFSLGQIGALAVSGMVSVEDAFRIAAFRAEVMAKAAAERDGAMCALMGGDSAEVEEVCAEYAQGDILVPANFNSPGQIVVSGDRAAVVRAQEAWVARPKHRAAMLATSGAFHSPLMQSAADEFAGFLAGIEFREASVPLVCNVDARPLAAADAADHLVRQVVSPVRFEQSVLWLAEQGVDTFVECGFGGVLVGLVRRTDKSAARFKAESAEDIAAVKEHLETAAANA